MTHSAACEYVSYRLSALPSPEAARPAIWVAIRKQLEKRTEEDVMISSSGDLIRQMWNTLESHTGSALDLVRKCYTASSPRPDVRVHESDYGPFTTTESATSFETCFEQEVEIRLVPPEHAWKTLRTKLVMLQQFPLDLEP